MIFHSVFSDEEVEEAKRGGIFFCMLQKQPKDSKFYSSPPQRKEAFITNQCEIALLVNLKYVAGVSAP